MEHIRINNNLRLEHVKLSMAPVIFETIDKNREFLKPWLPFVELTLEVSDTENFIKGIMSQAHRRKDEIFGIWYKEEFAGLTGFKDTDWVNRKTEVGYWIAEKMQGKGIVTTCVKELVKYSFQKLKLNRVQIKVAVGNVKSAAIPRRLGFALEGIERSGELHMNSFFDLEVYSLLKSDWLSQLT